MGLRRNGLWAIAATALLVPTAAEAASTRYAEPGGNGPPSPAATACPISNPCNLQSAVEDAAVVDGDRILVLGGTHNLGAGEVTAVDAITIEPAPGAGRPRLVSTSSNSTLAVQAIAGDAVVAGLEVLNLGPFGSGLRLDEGTAQRMVVSSTGVNACIVGDALIRDSTCVLEVGSISVNGALSVEADDTATFIARAVNVTAISKKPSGDGLVVRVESDSSNLALAAHNVIASGSPDAQAAVASGASGSSSSITLTSSSFDTVGASALGESVTAPGTGSGNITSPAQFAGLANGDYHPLASSPTVDKGSPDPFLGALDLDGAARTQGAAPDIGAYEFPSTKPKKCKRKKPKKKPKASAPGKKKKKKKKKGCKKKRKKKGK